MAVRVCLNPEAELLIAKLHCLYQHPLGEEEEGGEEARKRMRRRGW